MQIDEEGVKAATYIEFPGAGSAEPPEEIIDFVLDRPFLFVITNGNILSVKFIQPVLIVIINLVNSLIIKVIIPIIISCPVLAY